MEKCKRCGRPLKSEKSRKIGYGPSCAKLEGIVQVKQKIIKSKGEDLSKWN